MHVEREIGADPHDFRLWVCLHEETHRVQFTAVPWMRDHLFEQMQAIAATLEPTSFLEDGLKRVAEARPRQGGGSLIDLIGTPEQQEIVDRVTGVMSLLEGHADVVMDGVGPAGDPVGGARSGASFDERRKGVGALDRLLRRLLGLDAKMAQYRDGAAFVRHVVDKVGMDDFNAVWAGPREPALQGRDRRPRRLGHPRALTGVPDRRLTPEPGSPMSLHPAVAAVRLGVRRDLADLAPGATVLVACSGGRRLAGPARRDGLRGPRARAGGSSGRPSTTACRRAPPRTPSGSSRRWRGSAWTRR